MFKSVLTFLLQQDVGNSFTALKIYKGSSGELAPWSSFATLASFLAVAGFTIRAVKIFMEGAKSDNPKSTMDAILNLGYGAAIYAVVNAIINYM